MMIPQMSMLSLARLRVWRAYISPVASVVMAVYTVRLLGMDDVRPWPEALKDYLVAKGHILELNQPFPPASL